MSSLPSAKSNTEEELENYALLRRASRGQIRTTPLPKSIVFEEFLFSEGLCKIFKARDTKTRETLAVKIYLPKSGTSGRGGGFYGAGGVDSREERMMNQKKQAKALPTEKLSSR